MTGQSSDPQHATSDIKQLLTGRSRPLSPPPRTSSAFWCVGSEETADLPWPSCTDSSDARSHDWLWNSALRTESGAESKPPSAWHDNAAAQTEG